MSFIHKRLVVVAVLFGSILAVMAPQAGAATAKRPNVEFYYGYDATKHRVVDTTTVYIGHGQWKTEGSTTKDGGLVVSKHGLVSFRLAKGEKLVEAFSDYGTESTLTFKNYLMNTSENALPFAILKAAGKTHKIKLTDVDAEIYQPGRPLPPPKGTGV